MTRVSQPAARGSARARSLLLAVPAAAQATFERPGLITSVGQSSDVAIVKVMLNTQLKLGLDVQADRAARPTSPA